MNTKSKNLRIVLLITAALICAAVFALSFSDGSILPTWKDILEEPSSIEFDKDADYIKFLDVGQGDSILIYSNGYSALIDTGTVSSASNICQDLEKARVETINALIITHPHADHAGGLPLISERYKIENLIIPEYDKYSESASAINEAKQDVIKENGGVYTAVQGMNFKLGDFEITVIAYYPEIKGENNQSAVVMAKIGEKKFLFTGDAETATEKAMIEEGLNLDCDVLKVGHHGSDTSSSKAFIDATTPEFAVISVGEDNRYSHPSNEVLTAFNNADSEIYRTDKSGDIIFYIENSQIRTVTEK